MPKKKSEYIQKLLHVQNEHQRIMNQIVVNSIHEQEGLVHKLYDDQMVERSFGEVVSDKLASFGGSWVFICSFMIFIVVWMYYNEIVGQKAFDPYPYILLNLILSCLAAIQAPVILMSQGRKEARDRQRAQDDYLINLKAELESRAASQKLDLLINEQIKELIEIQKIQIDKLELLENILKKSSKDISSKEQKKK